MGCNFSVARFAPIELRGRLVLFARLQFALDPYLRGPVMLPVGKQAHAVSGAEDGVEVMRQLIEVEILIHGLRHLECRQQVKRNARDDAHRPKAHDRAQELIAILVARKMNDFAVRGYDLEAANRRCQIAVVDAGAVCRRGDRARNRDVWQRRKVVKRIAARVNDRRELTVFDSRADRNRAGLVVDVNLVEALERDLILRAVGDAIKGVA